MARRRRARPHRGRGRAARDCFCQCCFSFLERVSQPTRLQASSARSRGDRLILTVRIGRVARQAAPIDALGDGGQAEHREGEVEVPVRRCVAAGPPAIGGDVVLLGRQAKLAPSRRWQAVRRIGQVVADAVVGEVASGWPSVDSSQSSTATIRGSVGWTIRLPSRKSPWTIVGRLLGGHVLAGSQAISLSIASMCSVLSAAYCLVQRGNWRAKYWPVRP